MGSCEVHQLECPVLPAVALALARAAGPHVLTDPVEPLYASTAGPVLPVLALALTGAAGPAGGAVTGKSWELRGRFVFVVCMVLWFGFLTSTQVVETA